ncbi:uncharacterized protein BCR38DRAFT_153847 [Pseudomassariella vexata]|uniref:C2H2-type domain-containing protein n=1 Tax=Pseudomassariella vexata TaxID=1141098 RepID=A0A1Y2E759_9PEZI|nr:uncharacterized protein BCR38DRAFT_153847 [Pseudomassariella vexata]ORY67267.1 hypothetical protein BCR38DRAFT_153847 [Pseudomassariella vexata]
MEVGSFASRRPAAGGLPHFQLPPPNPVDINIPRVTGSEGLSPLSSSVNSGSSQSSQAGGIPPYNPPPGNWQLPGPSSYTYSSPAMNQGQTGLIQPQYGRNIYSPPTNPYHRSSQSPATGNENLAPPFDNVPTPFPMPGGGSGHSSLPPNSSHQSMHHSTILSSQASGSQPQTASTTAPADSYSRSMGNPGGFYASSSSASQQPSYSSYAPAQPSPTQPSPTTTAGLSRGIPAMNTHLSPMQAPQQYSAPRPYHYSSMPQTMPVMSNLQNPNSQMTMMGSMGGLPPHAYQGHHLGSHLYTTGQPSQQDRPFKCDQCPQSFNRNHDLKRHKRIHLAVKPFPCEHCDKSFSRKDALKRHRLVKGCGQGKSSPTSGNDTSPRDDIKQDPDGRTNSIGKDA